MGDGMISKELLGKFKKLYQDQFNITLSDEEATEAAMDLVNLMKILLKPLPKSNTTEERTVNETYRPIQY